MEPVSPPPSAPIGSLEAPPEAPPEASPEAPAPAPPVDAAPKPSIHVLAGFLAVALIDLVVVEISVPRTTAPVLRAALHFHDAFQIIAVGLVATGLVLLYGRLAPRFPRLGYVAAGVVAGAASIVVLREDLSGVAERLPQSIPLAVSGIVLPILAAQAVPLAAILGRLMARPKIRVLGCVLGAGLTFAHGLTFPQSYEGIHLLAAVFAAVLIGASLRSAKILGAITPAKPTVRLAIAGGMAAVAAGSLFVKPGNAVALLITRRPSIVLEPYLDRGNRPMTKRHFVPRDQRAWFSDRKSLPPIPPSMPRLLPDPSIVLLIGIDSLRADVLANEEHRAVLPNLFSLRDRGTYFSAARAAGSSTAPSIAAIFASKSYSQLYWTTIPSKRHLLVFPHTDTTPRFPSVLAAAGVTTYTADGVGWLLNEHGIVRGFTEEESFAVDKRHAFSKTLLPKIMEQLTEPPAQSFFGFTHLLDAHYPYEYGGKKATLYQSYIGSLAETDRQIGRMLKKIEERGLASRTAIVIMADHGEAFGEHGVGWHATSVYDELLRVPLIIVLPEGRAQTVDEPVSLMDIGPTILDLMGVPTPSFYMGESLTGFLRGERPKLRRPIVAEARLKRGMVFPDGFKIVQDARTVELFDLGKDPVEQTNIYDDSDVENRNRLGTLEAYFDAHTFKKKGYKVPYRKW